MISQLFKKEKSIDFERTYPAPVKVVWRAVTEPELVREWWGPEKTSVPECEIDLRVGGSIHIVTEAGPGMGKYAGTRWPMSGTFTVVEPRERLAYDARSWTEGEEASTTIVRANELTLTAAEAETTIVGLHISITDIGPGAKMAAFGMKYGWKQYLEKLDEYLARS